MTDPEETTCPFCGVTSDGLQHAYNCPVLQYDDSDDEREIQSDGMTPPEHLTDPTPVDNDGATLDIFDGDDTDDGA